MPLLVEPPRSPRLVCRVELRDRRDRAAQQSRRRRARGRRTAIPRDSVGGVGAGSGAAAAVLASGHSRAGLPRPRRRLAAHYTDFADLMQSRVDGLIVTGCEPVAARLPQEPVWGALTEVIDWAEHNTRSAIWSCLAAHAAVLHLDGIDRRPLRTQMLRPVHRWSAPPRTRCSRGVRAPLVVPHSRWNGLDEADLAASGYEVADPLERGRRRSLRQALAQPLRLPAGPSRIRRGRAARRVSPRRAALSGAVFRSTYPDQPADYFPEPLAAELAGIRGRGATRSADGDAVPAQDARRARPAMASLVRRRFAAQLAAITCARGASPVPPRSRERRGDVGRDPGERGSRRGDDARRARRNGGRATAWQRWRTSTPAAARRRA